MTWVQTGHPFSQKAWSWISRKVVITGKERALSLSSGIGSRTLVWDTQPSPLQCPSRDETTPFSQAQPHSWETDPALLGAQSRVFGDPQVPGGLTQTPEPGREGTPPLLQEDTLLSVRLGLLTRTCPENTIVWESRPNSGAGVPLAPGLGWGEAAMHAGPTARKRNRRSAVALLHKPPLPDVSHRRAWPGGDRAG